ncbi:hypothetical protein [Streptosporangium sp. NPDC002721]|uniref:hypothetical protein n=1 Tax=Streptosporangium sp. NPDC002721 TaxID=3366188 RepID=UPI00369DE996
MDEVEPLRMPPMVLYMGEPAFLLRWRRTAGDMVIWWGELAIPHTRDVPGTDLVHMVTHRWVESSDIVTLPGVDYDVVPHPGRPARRNR